MNYQRVLRGSLAVPMRHHLTTVPLARQGTDGVAAGKLFLGRDRGVTFSASSTGERGLAGPTPSTSGKTIFLVLNDTDPYLHPEGDRTKVAQACWGGDPGIKWEWFSPTFGLRRDKDVSCDRRFPAKEELSASGKCPRATCGQATAHAQVVQVRQSRKSSSRDEYSQRELSYWMPARGVDGLKMSANTVISLHRNPAASPLSHDGHLRRISPRRRAPRPVLGSRGRRARCENSPLGRSAMRQSMARSS
eukprot:scaffold141625_cov145-Phaeocystis_antarctica.AAC.1